MKVLIIGLGSIAKKHIHALRNIDPGIEIYALRSSRVSTSIERVIEIYDYSEINHVLPNFIIISNPTSEHEKTIDKLIKFKIPLFIEKPLFNSLDYDGIVKKVKANNVPTYIACNLRFLDSLIYAKSFILKKRVNEVNIYCGSYLPSWRPKVDFRTVYSANREMGGGVDIDLIHEIDYLVWFFGLPNSIKKTATNNSSLGISAFDYANYLMGYGSFSANVTLNYYRRNPKRILEIVCEDGECVVDLLHNTVEWNGNIQFKSNKIISDTYYDQMIFYIKNILNKHENKDSFNDIEEAYNILKVCLEH